MTRQGQDKAELDARKEALSSLERELKKREEAPTGSTAACADKVDEVLREIRGLRRDLGNSQQRLVSAAVLIKKIGTSRLPN